MTEALYEAAAALADTLALENVALTRLDLPSAAALLEEKQRAAAAFAAAQAGATPESIGALPMPALAGRLRDLATENRRLLEHGLRVQGRVLACVTHALPRALASADTRTVRIYAPSGTVAPARAAAMVISARA